MKVDLADADADAEVDVKVAGDLSISDMVVVWQAGKSNPVRLPYGVCNPVRHGGPSQSDNAQHCRG